MRSNALQGIEFDFGAVRAIAHPITKTDREVVQKQGLAKTLWAGLMWRVRGWLLLCQVQVRTNEQGAGDREVEGITVRLATREELIRATEEEPNYLTRNFVEAALARSKG